MVTFWRERVRDCPACEMGRRSRLSCFDSDSPVTVLNGRYMLESGHRDNTVRMAAMGRKRPSIITFEQHALASGVQQSSSAPLRRKRARH